MSTAATPTPSVVVQVLVTRKQNKRSVCSPASSDKDQIKLDTVGENSSGEDLGKGPSKEDPGKDPSQADYFGK